MTFRSTSLIIANPFWGAEYAFSFFCIYQGLNLDCGSHRVRAAVSNAERECFTHTVGCRVEEFVEFVTPVGLTAVARYAHRKHFAQTFLMPIIYNSRPDGAVRVDWRLSSGGWIPPRTLLRVEDASGKIILATRDLGEEERSVDLEELKETKDYNLTFTPGGSGLPREVVENSASLVLRT